MRPATQPNQTPTPPTPLHQHRSADASRSVVAIHTDEPDEPPQHTHPGLGPATPYATGPVPVSAAASVLTDLRRERAEAELAFTRSALRTLDAEHQQLRRLADALLDAFSERGWALPPEITAVLPLDSA